MSTFCARTLVLKLRSNRPLVSIASSQLMRLAGAARIFVSVVLSRQWANTQCYGRYRAHLFQDLPLTSRISRRYQLILLGDRGTRVWTTCLRLLHLQQCRLQSWSRTRDLSIASPTLYPWRNCVTLAAMKLKWPNDILNAIAVFCTKSQPFRGYVRLISVCCKFCKDPWISFEICCLQNWLHTDRHPDATE